MLTRLLQDTDIKLLPLVRKALTKMVQDHDHPLSLDHLDAFVHNKYVAPTEKDLRNVWAKLEPLLAHMMVEPTPAPKAPKLQQQPTQPPKTSKN